MAIGPTKHLLLGYHGTDKNGDVALLHPVAVSSAIACYQVGLKGQYCRDASHKNPEWSGKI